MGGLDRDQAGDAAAEPAVLTALTLLVASVCCWMLGLASSRCRRPLRHLCPPGEDMLRRLLAGPLIIEPWADMVSQHVASRLALTNAAARAFVWRRLAVIAAERLLLVSVDRLLTGRRRAALYAERNRNGAAIGRPGTAIEVSSQRCPVLTLARLLGVYCADGRRIAMPETASFGCFRTSTSTQWF